MIEGATTMPHSLPNFLEENSTKSQIFNVAARLFSEKGYNGVSMREISEVSGVSKPTIYYHFGSKEGIYTELMEAGLHYNLEIFQKIMEKDIPIKEKIVEIVKVRFSQVYEYPELAKFFLELYTSTKNLPFLEKFVLEANQRRQMLVDLIKQGIDNGEFGPTTNPELAAEVYVGSVMYFLIKQLNSQPKILTDKLAEDIVELLFKGLNE